MEKYIEILLRNWDRANGKPADELAQEICALFSVSNQRELLIAFKEHLDNREEIAFKEHLDNREEKCYFITEYVIDEFIESNL